ncbi:MAG: RluA family pseudouridine synthase [Alphaproteobacteria bacterium]
MAPDSKESLYRVRASPDDAGARLDKFLSAALPELSRTRLKGLIEQRRVTASGETIADPSYRVKHGQSFAVIVPEPVPARPKPQRIVLDVVYEDDEVIVVDKPAGLVVHPAPGNRDSTLVNALLAHCGDSLSGIGGVLRPGIVHRLDKDTSGLMVVAKTDAAHAKLSAQFASRRITRAYTALVWGIPRPGTGVITGNIGRNPRNRKKMAVVARGGKPAVTRYRLLRALGERASLIECRLETGRTHQIRVHLAAKGHPIVGDRTYGGGPARRVRGAGAALTDALKGFTRHALHAHLIGFEHPASGKRLEFSSDLPHDINEVIDILEVF